MCFTDDMDQPTGPKPQGLAPTIPQPPSPSYVPPEDDLASGVEADAVSRGRAVRAEVFYVRPARTQPCRTHRPGELLAVSHGEYLPPDQRGVDVLDLALMVAALLFAIIGLLTVFA